MHRCLVVISVSLGLVEHDLCGNIATRGTIGHIVRRNDNIAGGQILKCTLRNGIAVRIIENHATACHLNALIRHSCNQHLACADLLLISATKNLEAAMASRFFHVYGKLHKAVFVLNLC